MTANSPQTSNRAHQTVIDLVTVGLAPMGFVPDPERIDFWLAPTRSVGLGTAGVFLIGDESPSPSRWDGYMLVFWDLPEVRKLDAELRSDWKLKVTVSASVWSFVDDYFRRNADRSREVSPGEPAEHFVTPGIKAVQTGWDRWVSHFTDVDTAITYLANPDLLDRQGNLMTGFLLAALMNRPEDANRFIELIFSSRRSLRRYREDYDEMAEFFRRGAAKAGMTAPAIPTFEQLAARDT